MDPQKNCPGYLIYRRVCDAYFGRGSVFSLTGDYDAAYDDFAKLLYLGTKAKAPGECGMALSKMGYILYLKAKYAEALVHYDQAKEQFEKVRDHKMLADVCSQVAFVYRIQGKYQQAVGLIEKAIGFFSRHAEKEPGRLWNALGHTFWRSGNFHKALRCYEKALDLVGDDRLTRTAVLNNLGLLYTDMKRYKRALDFHAQALTMRGEMNDKPGLASSYLNIGIIYMNMKEYEQAGDYWQKAMAISTELRILDITVMCQNNIAELTSCQGNYREAIDMFKRTIRTKRRLGMNSYLPSSYHGLAQAYYREYKKQGNALMLEKSLDAAKKLNGVAEKLNDKFHLKAARRIIARIKKLRNR